MEMMRKILYSRDDVEVTVSPNNQSNASTHLHAHTRPPCALTPFAPPVPVLFVSFDKVSTFFFTISS